MGNGGGGASQLVVWSVGTKDLERQTGVVAGNESGTVDQGRRVDPDTAGGQELCAPSLLPPAPGAPETFARRCQEAGKPHEVLSVIISRSWDNAFGVEFSSRFTYVQLF